MHVAATPKLKQINTFLSACCDYVFPKSNKPIKQFMFELSFKQIFIQIAIRHTMALYIWFSVMLKETLLCELTHVSVSGMVACMHLIYAGATQTKRKITKSE